MEIKNGYTIDLKGVVGNVLINISPSNVFPTTALLPERFYLSCKAVLAAMSSNGLIHFIACHQNDLAGLGGDVSAVIWVQGLSQDLSCLSFGQLVS